MTFNGGGTWEVEVGFGTVLSLETDSDPCFCPGMPWPVSFWSIRFLRLVVLINQGALDVLSACFCSSSRSFELGQLSVSTVVRLLEEFKYLPGGVAASSDLKDR